MTLTTQIAALPVSVLALALAGCAPAPKVCHDGKLYEDSDGDGIYTKPDDWGDVDCVSRLPTKGQDHE